MRSLQETHICLLGPLWRPSLFSSQNLISCFVAIQSLRSSACPHALCFGQQHEAGAGIFYGEITFFNTKSYMSEDKLDSNEEDTKIYDGYYKRNAQKRN